MGFFNIFNGFVIFADHLVDIGWVGMDFFKLSYSSELFFPFCTFDRVSSLILFDLLVWLCLHVILIYLIKELESTWRLTKCDLIISDERAMELCRYNRE